MHFIFLCIFIFNLEKNLPWYLFNKAKGNNCFLKFTLNEEINYLVKNSLCTREVDKFTLYLPLLTIRS